MAAVTEDIFLLLIDLREKGYNKLALFPKQMLSQPTQQYWYLKCHSRHLITLQLAASMFLQKVVSDNLRLRSEKYVRYFLKFYNILRQLFLFLYHPFLTKIIDQLHL